MLNGQEEAVSTRVRELNPKKGKASSGGNSFGEIAANTAVPTNSCAFISFGLSHDKRIIQPSNGRSW